jgi:predicted  nucleic acid-binding Zn-ribbon protein
VNIVELSAKKLRNGRRPIKLILLTLHPDSCVNEEGIGSQYNLNGITWIRKYVEEHIDTINGMSITVEFVDPENRVEILGHGQSEVIDGLPTFNSATQIGTCTKGYITDVEINGETKTVLMAEGHLDEMRYKPFVDALEEQLQNNQSPETSVEIFKNPERDAIEYLAKKWSEFGRVPVDFIFSGVAILAVKGADGYSTVVELNNKNPKEDTDMDEKTMNELAKVVATEVKSVLVEKNEIQKTIDEKDAKISELNASVETIQAALKAAEADRDKLYQDLDASYAETKLLREELAKAKVAERLGELNAALAEFTDEEKKYAESEINSFKENPIEGDISVITTKIDAEIGKKAREEKRIAEQNATKNESHDVDIFGEIREPKPNEETKEVSIF